MRKANLLTSTVILIIFLYNTYSVSAQRSFDTKVDYPTGNFPESVAIGDINNDGYADLVVANDNSNSISVLTNTGSGSFGNRRNYTTGSGPCNVALGDITGDGNLDVVVTNRNANTISILTNTGNGSFSNKIDYQTGSYPTSVAIGDLNHDGKLDLAVANFNSNSVSVYLNTLAGFFSTRKNYATGLGPNSVAIGDFGNGNASLVVANNLDESVSVLTGNAIGTFSAKADYVTGKGPTSVAVGDLNGDGKMDIVTANASDKTTTVLISMGTGNWFTTTGNFPTGSSPFGISIGDLNSDGKLDLAIANYGSNTVSILTNTGNGSLGAKIDYNTGLNPYSVAIGDLNNDGKSDLAIANWGSNTLSVLIAKDIQQIGGLVFTNKVYGQYFSFNATSTSGFPITYESSNSSIVSILNNSATATGIGVVTITAFQTGNGSWMGITTTGVLTITKANLSIQVNNAFKVYGDVIPNFSGTFTGVFFNDIINFSTDATSLSGVGNYSIFPSGAALKNYNYNTLAGILTISPKNATIIVGNLNRTYGSQNPIFNGTLIGILNNEIVSFSTTATSFSGIGNYSIIPSGLTLVNYNLTTIAGLLTILPKLATFIGFNLQKVYGSENPAILGSISGLLFAESIESAFYTNCSSLSGVGNYQIVPIASGTELSNYDLATVIGIISVTPKVATVIGNNFTRVYGSDNPIFSGTVLGIVNNDAISLSFSTLSTSLSGVGNYTIFATATGVNINNYNIINKNGILTIIKAEQEIFGCPSLVSISGIVTSAGINSTYIVPFCYTSTSKLPVILNLIGSAVLSGTNTISFTGIGILTVTAFQAGNSNYESASLVLGTISVFSDVGTGIVDDENNILINVFPNPNGGNFNIEASEIIKLNSQNNKTAQIYDIHGKLVLEEYLYTGKNIINTSLKKGIYLVKIGTYLSKIIVE